ncbi:MAG: tRNA (adenosine(37)-N6)-dimethylallyltransferase MiaA [Gemmatimonadaceae bacterium]|nr:tRNA (adenosine(37)-N6)-dimethylallyltransferase MiaA [Gemmatimonadaceae bacterium]
MRDVAIICGPTAAGKSAIALALAARTGATLLSADSRQVYRRFDIGTAKPSAADVAAVPHRGLDLVEPTQRYSAAAWAAAALGWLAEPGIRRDGAIIVGGTGFYLHALTSPLFEAPPLDPQQRAAVLAALEAEATATLRERCQVIDPARAHLGRTQLLRAIEVFELTGRPLSEWQRERARPSQVRAHYLLVDPGDVLRDRIAARVAAMLDAGWLTEVESLAADVPDAAPAWNACGYALLRTALRGGMPLQQAVERTIIDTRQYAKRQRTWFRHQLPAERVTLLDPGAPDAIGRAMLWLESVSRPEHP